MAIVYPGLVVFDLDFTLWDCGGQWIDCISHLFIQERNGEVSASDGKRFRLYEEVLEIVDELDSLGVLLALASRTGRPDWAEELLDLWGIKERFRHREIYPGSKISHFENLQEATGIPYREMIFFDDEARNIIDVSSLGVHCHHVTRGINLALLRTALKSFSEKV